jgi:hypothetical protein
MKSKIRQLNDKMWLTEQYINQKKSTEAIGALLGCDGQGVLNYLKFHGIPRRQAGDWLLKTDANGVIDNKGVIEGLMLGDGYMERLVERGNPRITLHQKQKELVEFLRDTICPDASIIQTELRGSVIHGRKIKPTTSYISRTGCSPLLLPYYLKWYPKGKKIVPTDLELTSTNVLHWFIGDGSAYRRKNYNSVEIKLCTNGFTKDEVYFLGEQLKKLGLKSYIGQCQHSDPKRGYYIRLSTKCSQDFYKYIGKCPVRCMDYKWKI